MRLLFPAILLLAAATGGAAEVPAAGDAGLLGDEVRAGPVALRPPRGFVPLALAGRETAAAAPGPEGARRELLLVLSDDARDASLVVAAVEAPLEDGADARDLAAKATVDHFRDALDLDLRLSWATRGRSPGPALEVAGRFSLAGKERVATLAFFPVGATTYVVTLAAPAARADELAPAFEAAMRTFEAAPEAPARRPELRWTLSGIGAAVGLLVALAIRLRRRRAARAPR